MISHDWRFHHLGMAVRDPEKSAASLGWLGYRIGEAVWDENQKAYVQLCEPAAGMPRIELIYSADAASPVANLTRDQEQVLYHMCYCTDSIDQAVAQARAAGRRTMRIAPAKHALLFDGRPVAFYYVQGLGLIEFLEWPGWSQD